MEENKIMKIEELLESGFDLPEETEYRENAAVVVGSWWLVVSSKNWTNMLK